MPEQRSVQFWSDGLKLDGVLFLPDGYRPGERLPGVVICHGFTQHKEIFSLAYGTSLSRHGFACLSFDYRGFGGSEGKRGRLIPLEQVADARNAVAFLGTQPEVDPSRIGLLGTSFGGAVVQQAGVDDEHVRAVACFDGIGNGRRWFREQRRQEEWLDLLDRLDKDRLRRALTGESEFVDVSEINIYSAMSQAAHDERRRRYPEWQFMLPLETGQAVIEFAPEERIHKLAPRPLLVVYDPNPHSHAPEEARHIYERASEPKQLVAIPPGERQYSHYTGAELEHWIKIVADFLKEHLT
jgi:uncharacterized protein